MPKPFMFSKYPFIFKGISELSLAFIKQTRINAFLNLQHLQPETFEQFDLVHKNVLNAIQDQDLEYLQGIMENNLFQKTKFMINEINNENYKLNFQQQEKLDSNDEKDDENVEKEEDEESKEKVDILDDYAKSHNFFYSNKDMKIDIQAKGVFGVEINRQQNVNKKFMEFKMYRTRRNIFVNLKSLLDVYNKQILVFDVYYYTSRKLQILNSSDEIVHGTINPNEWQLNKWRFETKVNQDDWILTDIDDVIQEQLKESFYTKVIENE